MGIREIEDKLRMKELMKKKAAELKMVELDNKVCDH